MIVRHKILEFISLTFAILTLTTGFAHLLEIPNKMGLSGADYLTVQQIYRGWAWLGIIVFLAIFANLILTIKLRTQPAAFRYAAIALTALLGTQAVFWIFTYPVNRITDNWTQLPDTWPQLRRQWEYSHAASALLEFCAVTALALLLLRTGDRTTTGANTSR
jgi:hypothetical protein